MAQHAARKIVSFRSRISERIRQQLVHSEKFPSVALFRKSIHVIVGKYRNIRQKSISYVTKITKFLKQFAKRYVVIYSKNSSLQ